jgi:hypothetical protein
MTTKNNPWFILGLAFTGVAIFSFMGVFLLAVLTAFLTESSWIIPNFLQAVSGYRAAWLNSTGNEFTGEATAWLFGIAAAPVGINLICKTLIRLSLVGGKIKEVICRGNNLQKRYLMPMHTYLSIMALGIGVLHLSLSSCIANPLPEVGLIISGVLVVAGLLWKWKSIPSKWRKALYQFHASLIVSGLLLVILVIGHGVMGSD